MGVLDSFKGILSGSGKKTQPITLEPGESEVARTVACTLKGGRSWVGGDLVLTNRRLLFTPLNVADAAALLEYGLKKAGAPSSAVAAVGWMEKQAQPVTTELGKITSSTVGRPEGDLTHPPTLVAHLEDGTSLEFGVFNKRLERTGSHANVVARDEFLGVLTSRLS